MEAMLLEYGLPGVVIIALAGAVVRLSKLYIEVQEKRLAENREAYGAITSNTNALNKLSETVAALVKDER